MKQDALYQDKSGAGDAVAAIIEQWHRERPDLDPSAKEVTGRVIRLSGLFEQAYAQAYGSLGIGGGDFGVLAALRRSGAPFELTPTELARHRMMTSGGMTAVIDRLERKGLLERAPNPADRRGSLVRLTAAGRKTIDRAMELHAETEHRLVGGLSAAKRQQLAGLLSDLLLSLEGPAPT